MFTFNGDEELTYPDILVNGQVLVAVPGQSYALESAPDDRWTPVTSSKVAKSDTSALAGDTTVQTPSEGA